MCCISARVMALYGWYVAVLSTFGGGSAAAPPAPTKGLNPLCIALAADFNPSTACFVVTPCLTGADASDAALAAPLGGPTLRTA